MRLLRGVDLGEDRVDLLGRLVLRARDLELDERGAAVGGDLTDVGRVERRADVLDDVELRDPRDDVLDRRREGGVGGGERAALDEDALGRRLLEAGLEDLVHPAGLARAGGVRIDRLRPRHAAESEGDEDERQPPERRGLPVVGAPATHPGRHVVGLIPVVVRNMTVLFQEGDFGPRYAAWAKGW